MLQGAPVEISLQPAVLRWARERAGLNAQDLADGIGVHIEIVSMWERTGRLFSDQAEGLAHRTHTPLGMLYLSTPPVESLPVADFRVVGRAAPARLDLDLLDLIDGAKIRQDWYRDYALGNGEAPHGFVGRSSVDDAPDDVAATIRDTLGWSTEVRALAPSWEDAVRLSMGKAEDAGILVMRSGVVGNNTRRPIPVEKLRGFALSDEYAPLVFINGRDSKGAQLFTLAHEVAHIWIGESGVSNLARTYAPDHAIERFCNKVAAEVLVPSNELRERIGGTRPGDDPLSALCAHFKVSGLVLLRRLRDIGFLRRDEFERRYDEEEAQRRPTQSGGGNFYTNLRYRVGERFAMAVVTSTLSGRTPYRDAFRLLGVRDREKLVKLGRVVGLSI